ncbi:MAG: hypothetical protein K0S65_4074, partial [Labilithrix sp.]|nr:hypothetical protein [Labilithrix sp.]
MHTKRHAEASLRRASLVALAVLAACTTSEAKTTDPVKTPVAAPPAIRAVSATNEASPPPAVAVYPWGPHATTVNDRLDGRFRSPPPGFARVKVPGGSFGEFLRSLPLQPEGAPVVDFRGN